jgi:hypothetical protein
MTASSAHWMARCRIDVPSSLMLSSPFAALEMAAVSPFLSASKTLNRRTLCSMLAPWVALEGVTELASGSLLLCTLDMSMLSLLDMVFETRGRLPTFEVREALGCRLVGLLVFSAMVSSATGECGGTSPRLETRLSRERATVDFERLWLLLVPVLRRGRGSAKEEGLEGNEGIIEGAEGCLCLCLCGLGERRDVMSTIAAAPLRIGRKEGFGGGCAVYTCVCTM